MWLDACNDLGGYIIVIRVERVLLVCQKRFKQLPRTVAVADETSLAKKRLNFECTSQLEVLKRKG